MTLSQELIYCKKYIDQEPPYLMRQISGKRSKHRIQNRRIIFEGQGHKGWNKNIFNIDQKAKNHMYSL